MKKDNKKESEEKVSEKQEKASEPHEKSSETDEKPDLNTKKKQTAQIISVIIIMVALVLIFFIVPYFVRIYLNGFSYGGLSFEKTQTGNLIYYSTYVPLADQNLKIVGSYPINLRNDPRKLEYINANLS